MSQALPTDSLAAYPASDAPFWAVVLAGGRGSRMQKWIELTFGERRPKQFCAFTGSRTMLEHTLDRARRVVPADHIMTVVTRDQAHHVPRTMRAARPGRLVVQPEDRGTAVGALLAIAPIVARDPDAVVLVLPADHYVRPESVFIRHAKRACAVARDLPDKLVLLGALPDGPETDYGWILHAPENGRASSVGLGLDEPPRSVIRFREKPGHAEAARLLEAGALWNTLVLAGRACTLWATAARLLPDVCELIEAIDGQGEDRSLARVYGTVRSADLSRDVLELAADVSVVIPMKGLEWSDWGRPERVRGTLQRLRLASPLDSPRPE
jgi:mannose-1-phosphate guanylyltransferase